MRKEVTYEKIKQKTCKKVPNTVATNHTNHIQNSVQGTKVPNNHTEHIKNTAQGINVTNDETEHIQNSA